MYALLSVSDKEGIVEFGRDLVALGYEILSTGGTLKLLLESQVPAIDVGEYTQSEELFDGRVKTLHPKIHGGILYRREYKDDVKVATQKGIGSIDIVCVNLYPFKQTIQRTQDFAEIIENIDIGGPAMVRSAAKNHASVLVVTDKADYKMIIESLKNNQNTLELRQKMMIKAYEHTASYDSTIANYMNERFNGGFGEKQFIVGQKVFQTHYGENPHQSGALYEFASFWQKHFVQKKGEASFNNLTDMNAAVRIASAFGEDSKAVCIVKHGNPCGFGLQDTLLDSYKAALKCDSVSAYGGVAAINGEVGLELAKEISKMFIEVLVAKGITQEALEIFESKKRMKIFIHNAPLPKDKYDFKHIQGGFVFQNSDYVRYEEIMQSSLKTQKAPDVTQQKDLEIAYTIAALTKSNCVVYVKDSILLAIGMGMTSRVDAARAAFAKAKDMGLDLQGCVCASEAFFPFRDSVDMAHRMGVTAIIQPGGSIRDDEVIEACNEYGIAMLFTHTRHFLH